MQNTFFSKKTNVLAIQMKLPSTVFWNSLNSLIKHLNVSSWKWDSHFGFVQFPMAFMNHLFTSLVATILIVHLTLRKWNIFLIGIIWE